MGKLELNKFQKRALGVYCNGEYKYIKTEEELMDCGDTLFIFLMLELSDAEDCDNITIAITRIKTAIADLQEVLGKF
jgi:hypothetical protein